MVTAGGRGGWGVGVGVTSVCSFRVLKEPMELPAAGGSFIATRVPQGVVRRRTRPDMPSPST